MNFVYGRPLSLSERCAFEPRQWQLQGLTCRSPCIVHLYIREVVARYRIWFPDSRLPELDSCTALAQSDIPLHCTGAV